jgi:outer membrane protein assembly factor BamB
VSESLEDHLRRATRNFTSRLPEDQVLALGARLARELARAHGETPPRHPELEPSRIAMTGTEPRLDGGRPEGTVRGDLFELGALLHSLLTGDAPAVAWRLDGPPPADATTLKRRAVLQVLASPRGGAGVDTASDAAAALEAAAHPDTVGTPAWPLFRGAPQRTGAPVRDAGGTAGPASRLVPRWHAATGAVIASPIVAGGLVLAPTVDGRLVFVDRGSGRLLHEIRLGSAVESSPALVGSVLHVGTDDGEVVAIDVVTGREVMRLRAGTLVRSSPLPVGDRVLVGVVDDAKKSGAVLAYEAASGKVLWRRKLGPVFSSPALAGEVVLVGSDDGALHALSAADGAVRWSASLTDRVRATPCCGPELCLVADFKGRLAGVALGDGRLAWSRELGHPVYSSAALGPHAAAVGCHDGRVHGFDPATGAERFRLETRGPVVSSPVAWEDGFLAASTDGHLYLLDAEGGARSAVLVAREGLQSSPALDGDQVVLGSARGLHAVGLGA